jgi:uncharacterized protein
MPSALRVLVCLFLCGCRAGAAGGEDQPRKPAVEAHAGQGEAAAQGARVVLLPEGRDPISVPVEVARTAPERSRGLMFRVSLPENEGMLFLFERPDQLTFWMRNTLIPLDMIFIEDAMKVLGVVENAEPRTDTGRSVPGLSQYVLEMNGGWAQRHGIEAGTKVRFEGVAPATAASEGSK